MLQKKHLKLVLQNHHLINIKKLDKFKNYTTLLVVLKNKKRTCNLYYVIMRNHIMIYDKNFIG